MTPLGLLAAFALGSYLSIRMIAALYAIVDLWYTIGTAYPRVVRGILGWGAMILVIASGLRPPYRTAFGAGLLAFLLFYLSLYPLRHLFLRPPRRPS